MAALFRDFEDIEEVRIEMGAVAVAVRNPEAWDEMLLQCFDAVNGAFVPPRAVPPDRQYERAMAEIGDLDVGNPRDLARILDATTSPDAAYRRLAVAMLEIADPIVVQKPWTRALEDSSRAVRRATARAMANIGGADLPRRSSNGRWATRTRASATTASGAWPRSASAGPTRPSSAANVTTTHESASPPSPPWKAEPPNTRASELFRPHSASGRYCLTPAVMVSYDQ